MRLSLSCTYHSTHRNHPSVFCLLIWRTEAGTLCLSALSPLFFAALRTLFRLVVSRLVLTASLLFLSTLSPSADFGRARLLLFVATGSVVLLDCLLIHLFLLRPVCLKLAQDPLEKQWPAFSKQSTLLWSFPSSIFRSPFS